MAPFYVATTPKQLSLDVNRYKNIWCREFEPKAVGATVRCEGETRKPALSPLLGSVLNKMKRPDEDKRELGDWHTEQGRRVKRNTNSVQIAVQVPLLDLDARLINDQIDAVRRLINRRNVLSLFGAVIDVRIDLSPLVTLCGIVTVNTRPMRSAIEKNVIVLTVGGILSLERKKEQERVSGPEPRRDASVGEGNQVTISAAIDEEGLITANSDTLLQGASSIITSDQPSFQAQPGDFIQMQAPAKSLQGLFPVFYVWVKEAEKL